MNNHSNDTPSPYLPLITLQEFLKLPPKPTKPYTSSPWDFDEDALTLELYEVMGTGKESWLHEVALASCRTPAELLLSIMHVPQEVWASDHALASLVRDLFLYLGPDICFGPGTTDATATIKKNIPEANALRGRPSQRASQNGNASPDQTS